MEESTVTYLRRLRPYPITKGGHYEDPHVREIFDECLEPETITALHEYTRGMYDPDLHYTSFFFFKRPVSTERLYGFRTLNHPNLNAAIDRVRYDLRELRGLHMIRSNDFDSVIWNPSTAAGYGYHGLKRDNYYEARRNASRALYDFAKWGDKYRFVPDKAFARSQLALRANPKIRHVWGRAFHHILIEGCVAQPIIHKLLLSDTPIFIGRDIHKDMPAAIHRLIETGATTYCLDFSKFDTSLNGDLIDIVWSIIYDMFEIRDYGDQLLFDFCYTLFKNVPLVMPDGRLYSITTGIASGTYFTQITGSIANLILIYMLQDYYNCPVPTKVLGDDSIFATLDPVFDIDDARKFFEHLGLTISNKTIITRNYTDVIFLGHNFYGSRVTRDEFTCLSLALFTENQVTSPAETILRVSSLVFDAGFNSFGLFNLLKDLHVRYEIDWLNQSERPVTIATPFNQLFILG